MPHPAMAAEPAQAWLLRTFVCSDPKRSGLLTKPVLLAFLAFSIFTTTKKGLDVTVAATPIVCEALPGCLCHMPVLIMRSMFGSCMVPFRLFCGLLDGGYRRFLRCCHTVRGRGLDGFWVSCVPNCSRLGLLYCHSMGFACLRGCASRHVAALPMSFLGTHDWLRLTVIALVCPFAQSQSQFLLSSVAAPCGSFNCWSWCPPHHGV